MDILLIVAGITCLLYVVSLANRVDPGGIVLAILASCVLIGVGLNLSNNKLKKKAKKNFVAECVKIGEPKLPSPTCEWLWDTLKK